MENTEGLRKIIDWTRLNQQALDNNYGYEKEMMSSRYHNRVKHMNNDLGTDI
ncbi:MAG: hypothetical protein WBB45_15565 [Cyclobacteriaceae bacterium]